MRKLLAALLAVVFSFAGSMRAENIVVGTLIDDTGFFFNSFGNQSVLGTTRGANFAGSRSVTWQGVSMSNVSGANGISWSGATASNIKYDYTGYAGLAGTSADANDLTNSGIHGNGTSITISAIAGQKYVVDLLFANQFSGSGAGYYPYRTMDVSVGGLLYADDLTLYGTDSPDRRPLVYRFEVTPATSSINIVLNTGAAISGSPTDTNPYVNAVMVTVPEPSAHSLLVMGLGGVVAMRRSRKPERCVERPALKSV
ncbi:MAG: PEP-CTERM sorting domain-containing protein [Verrucomicrobia bacterium]|nr:PEP-CTERM sorting domain-containing protein [Verrucomicrobiota bacterium]